VTENTDLQFERAQFDEPAAQRGCKVCGTALYGSYFEANGHTVCEACSYKLREGAPAGSRGGRVLRAVGAGIGAAFAGTLLYWGILAATGYVFGLIAIVVGYAVGKAVHWGSRGRGGWAYQTLAIALTYLAIVSAYVPMVISAAMKDRPAAQTQSAPRDGSTTPAPAPSAASSPAQATGATTTPGTTAPAAADTTPPSLGTLLFALGALLLIACAAPFLAGAENIIGLVIIGIGMYEAWKLNRRVPLVITGPHALTSSGVAAIGR